LPGSPTSREAGRAARALGHDHESNPHKEENEKKGWYYGWVVEDGRAARLIDPSGRHLNYHGHDYWHWAWDQGWDDQDGWLAAGTGRDRSTNPYDAVSDAMAMSNWDRGWLRCQQDMKDCRKEGEKARSKNQPRESPKYSFDHLANSWRQGWDCEDAKIKQEKEDIWRRASEDQKKEQQRLIQQRDEAARLKQRLAQRILQLSNSDNDIAVDIEKTREQMKQAIDQDMVSRDEVMLSDRVYRLDRETFKVCKKLTELTGRDGTNSPAEAELIDCYLGPSHEHFNQQEHAVRSSLCRIFKRMLDHYPPEVIGMTCFPIRTIVGKLFGGQ
jgi:hypothetical protein